MPANVVSNPPLSEPSDEAISSTEANEPWFQSGSFVKAKVPPPSGARWHVLTIIQLKWIAILFCVLGLFWFGIQSLAWRQTLVPGTLTSSTINPTSLSPTPVPTQTPTASLPLPLQMGTTPTPVATVGRWINQFPMANATQNGVGLLR